MKNPKGLPVADLLGNWPTKIMQSKSKQPRLVPVVIGNKWSVIISVKKGKVSMRWGE